MKRIQEWLDNPQADFNEGVKLYNEFAVQRSYSDYFSINKNANAYTMPWNLLRGELMRIEIPFVEIVPVVSVFKSIEKDLKKLDKGGEKDFCFFEPNKLTEAGKLKFKRVQDIGKELASKKAMLDKAVTDEERQPFADALCLLEDERYSLWDDINSIRLEENKEEVLNSQDDAFKAVTLYKRILILRNNIARNEKDSANVPEERKEKLLSKADEFKAEMQAASDEFKTITGRNWDDKTE